jgi:hypothetical protein
MVFGKVLKNSEVTPLVIIVRLTNNLKTLLPELVIHQSITSAICEENKCGHRSSRITWWEFTFDLVAGVV